MTMPGQLTGFPNGVTSFGVPVLPGGLLTGGRKVLHVCNRTGCPSGDGTSPDWPLSTLFGASGALAKMQNTTEGGLILVWPGHAENIDIADKASDIGTARNVAIVGLGSPADRPTFTWTTAGSTWLFDTTGFSVTNCNILMDPGAGAVTVAAPITVSAAGCGLYSCRIRTSTDVNSRTTIPITTTDAGDDFTIFDCKIEGATAGECTTVIRLVGAHRFTLKHSSIEAATSAVAIGVVQFLTTASTGVEILDCYIRNNKAASEQAVTGLAGIGGFMDDTHLAVLSNAAAALTGAFSTPANFVFGRNVGITNLVGERAALFGTESA